jgi:hypothetical protein
MNKLKSYVLVVGVLCLSFASIAQPQDREIVNQSLQWFSAASNVKLSSRYTWYVEGQFRFADDFDPMQFQIRTAIDVTLSKHWVVTPGYVYTWNPLYGKQPGSIPQNNEHRLYGQLVYKHKFKTINLNQRIRAERRYIQQQGEGTPYDKIQYRIRYRFMATMPFKGEKIEGKSWFGSVYDEVFLSWGKPVTFHEPDQNRIFAGVGYQFNPSFNILAGPLYQMLIKSNGAKQENNVGLQVMATYNFDLSKKQD